MKRTSRLASFLPRIARAGLAFAALSLILVSTATCHAGLVFDNVSNAQNGVSGASLTSTSSTPNTFMGDAYSLAAGTTSITGFDLFPVNQSGTTFTNLKINIYVWGTVNTGTVSATTPAFSNELAQYTLTSTGTFTSGFYYSYQNASPGSAPGITLATPLAISSTTIGITLNYQGSTDGVTYNNVNSLTSLISYGTAPTVGSDVFNGYYRNANSETNGNFTSTLRSLGQTNQSLALRIYGNAATTAVPEPGSIVLVLSGMGVACLFYRNQRSAIVAASTTGA